jgi:AbrB family looped-hinge helix DNA binding protein
MSPRKSKRTKKPRRPGFSEEGAAYEAAALTPRVTHQTVELGAGGRIVIPAPMREALGIKVGDRLTVRLEGDELRVYTFEAAIRRIQHLVGPYLPSVDEFLRYKREEAAKEQAELDRWSRDE